MAGDRVQLNLGPLSATPSDRLRFNLGVEWDAAPPPAEPAFSGVFSSCGMRFAAAGLLGRGAGAVWAESARQSIGRGGAWAQASSQAAGLQFRWAGLPALIRAFAAAWASGPGLAVARTFQWRQLPRGDAGFGLRWAPAGALAYARGGAWRASPQVIQARGMRWSGLLPMRAANSGSAWRAGERLQLDRGIPWRVADYPAWRPMPPPVEPPSPPGTMFPPGDRIGLNLGCPLINAPGVAPLNLGVLACYGVRAAQRTYVVINTVTVVRLPDRVPIEVTSVQIGGSVSAYAWDLQMTLADDTDDLLLQPTSSGPARVEVAVNGWVWVFVIESRSRAREWTDDGLNVVVTLSGRSPTALLASPYAPLRAKVNTSNRLAQQLVQDELENTGFGLDYQGLDWVVPAGAWFYEGADPIGAVSRIAAARGAVVMTSADGETVRVRPRYPASPWDWTTTPADATVTDDVMFTESEAMRSRPLYNAVVVAGELEGKGVTVRAVRDGEAAVLYAEQVSDPLINAVPVATERARNVLSDRGHQSEVTHLLPVFQTPQPGLPGPIEPLQLVQVMTAGGNWMGLCIALSISARLEGSALVVEQSVTLERHHADAN